jgi:hypothetical protein
MYKFDMYIISVTHEHKLLSLFFFFVYVSHKTVLFSRVQLDSNQHYIKNLTSLVCKEKNELLRGESLTHTNLCTPVFLRNKGSLLKFCSQHDGEIFRCSLMINTSGCAENFNGMLFFLLN